MVIEMMNEWQLEVDMVELEPKLGELVEGKASLVVAQ